METTLEQFRKHTQRIELHLEFLDEKRAAVQARIAALEAAGCIHGNIVEEWRNKDGRKVGPYYRLTFYTDPQSGEKAKPVYLGAGPARVAEVQAQIDNHAAREELARTLRDMDVVRSYVLNEAESLWRYIVAATADYKQLVLPGLAGQLASHTNGEGQ